MATRTKPQPEPTPTPERVRKVEAPNVQAAMALATGAGMTVFTLGKHLVAVSAEGIPAYLGGGVDAPEWRLMRPVTA